MGSCGLILLAAGPSNRLGQPKQLLPYGGTTLIQHMLQIAERSESRPIVLVLGANSDIIRPLLDESKLCIVHNSYWEEGMASSIRCGLETLLHESPAVDAALIMVCDQPFVSTELLNDLVRTQASTRRKIITSAYRSTVGTPAVFEKSLFPLLMGLAGQEGAKKIILQHPEEVETISFPMGYIDVDTMQDYEDLPQPG